MAPIDIAKPGKFGGMIFERMSENTDFIEAIAIHPGVLQMDAENSGFELTQRPDVVHLLPNEVRRIVVEAEVGAGNFFEHTPPEGGAGSEIFAARPLVAREQHRAILDGDADAVIFGETDEIRPDGAETGPIVLDRARPIASDEGADHGNVQLLRALNDALEMGDAGLGFLLIGYQQVGIES